MPPQRTANGEDVRIGPITLFTLIVVLCMAVLAMLTFSTAHASLTMADRQATATAELYLDESAAQEFVACVDEQLVDVRSAGGTGAQALQQVKASLEQMRTKAQDAVDGEVSASAVVKNGRIVARFSCENGRTLNVVLTILDNATYRIDRWKMIAVQNETQPEGALWTGQ